jgi:hypothetical protein
LRSQQVRRAFRLLFEHWRPYKAAARPISKDPTTWRLRSLQTRASDDRRAIPRRLEMCDTGRMDKDTAPTVIVSIQPSGHIDYGPPGETRLDITLIDEHGTPFPVIIQGQALLRLAAIVRDIDARLPTALRSQVIRW